MVFVDQAALTLERFAKTQGALSQKGAAYSRWRIRAFGPASHVCKGIARRYSDKMAFPATAFYSAGTLTVSKLGRFGKFAVVFNRHDLTVSGSLWFAAPAPMSSVS